MTKRPFALLLTFVLLSGCASVPLTTPTSLSSTEGLKTGKAGRAKIMEKHDVAALNLVRKVFIQPVRLMTGEAPRYILKPEERQAVLSEVEAQLCFELSERYEIVSSADASDAVVRSAVTWFEPTGGAASGASAVAGFFIPGPIGLRVPGGLGGLGAEAEMLASDKQIAAIVWARRAQAIGTDSPSMSRLGDALQFAEPFGDDAARIMSPSPLPKKRTYPTASDPCARFGGRIHETGMVTGAITGLYTPADRTED